MTLFPIDFGTEFDTFCMILICVNGTVNAHLQKTHSFSRFIFNLANLINPFFLLLIAPSFVSLQKIADNYVHFVAMNNLGTSHLDAGYQLHMEASRCCCGLFNL